MIPVGPARVKSMGHSGELETSLMLHLAPRLVNQKDIPQGVLGIDEPGPMSGIKRYVNMKEHSAEGVIGMIGTCRS